MSAKTGEEDLLSLTEVFENADKIVELTGEMDFQKIAIFRFTLAALTSYYSKYDANDHVYPWLKVDSNYQVVEVDTKDISTVSQDLMKTWHQLYNTGHFSKGLFEYLNHFKDRFEVFGDNSCLTVPAGTYNNWVASKAQISTGNGEVRVRQMNRLISESGSRPTDINIDSNIKDRIDKAELTRWIIAYHAVTATVDKTKITSPLPKFSAAKGWQYGLNTIYVKGDSLFETLMFNLKLINDDNAYTVQRPTWEFESHDSYIKSKAEGHLPDNISELYTIWSRLVHVVWHHGQAKIFVASLPKVDNLNAFVEPMTLWRFDKPDYKPAKRILKSRLRPIWYYFADFTYKEQSHQPGVTLWLERLSEKRYLPSKMVTLIEDEVISDGNGASQLPKKEVQSKQVITLELLTSSSFKEKYRERVISFTSDLELEYWKFTRNLNCTISDELNNQFITAENKLVSNWLKDLKREDKLDKQEKVLKLALLELVKLQSKNAINQIPDAMSGKDASGNTKQSYRNFVIFNTQKLFDLED